MSFIRFGSVIGFACVTAMPACGSSSSDGDSGPVVNPNPTSQLVTLNPDNTIPDQNFSGLGASGSISVSYFSDPVLGSTGFAYAWGNVEGTDDFLGVAGIHATSTPGDAITTGAVTYDGRYDLLRVRGNVEDQQSGQIELTATFNSGRVTGSADGLEVNGTFSGNVTAMGGTVTFDGVTANMEGVVGQDRVVGAFAGDDADGILIGGIYGAVTP
ncbi:hypothetical protein [Cognatiyoonia sp. IB215182]|uniref:hypothetical protein n=1 Tax=Cognatiyoonia sp. IB215182 TaxID=3097353 RepID=UPI002A0D993B|nr:hypothetical protein [Cognatiyoonia sp. IB215182]MDX8355500.1 hypothetical protein [Cognatiyoonia sp. IB215182]